MERKILSEETFEQRHAWGNAVRKLMLIPSRVNTTVKVLELEWVLGVQRREKTKVQVAETECAMEKQQESSSDWCVGARPRGPCKPEQTGCETV